MRSKHAVLTLLIGAICLHGASLWWVHAREGSINVYAFRSLDCDEYYSIAKNIVEHGAFSQNSAPPLTPDTWRTPGYPLFLAITMFLVGNSPTALVLVQHALAIASILLFFVLASWHMSPRRAFIASLILLLEPYHLFYAFWLLSTTWFTLVLLVTWWLWERSRESASHWQQAALGLLAGFLVLIWPGAILIPIAILIGVVLVKLPHYHITTLPHRPAPSVLVLASCLLPLLTWMSRNYAVAGHFALSHQSGIVLAYFKATEAELWRQGRTQDRYLETSLDTTRRNEPHKVWDEIDAKLQQLVVSKCGEKAEGVPDPCRASELNWANLAQGNKTSHDSFVVSHLLATLGASMLMKSPLSSMACWVTRIGENLVFPLSLFLRPAREAPTNRFKSAMIGGAYAVLALAAVLAPLLRRRTLPAIYFPTCCLIALALTTAPQIDPRFRVPMIPCLAFLALLPSRRAESE